jgi:H+-transporting ATPase
MNAETVASVAKPLQEQIAARAYCIWLQEGRRDGRDVEHWLQAEAELTAACAQPPSENAPAPNVASAVAQALPDPKKAAKPRGRAGRLTTQGRHAVAR